MARFVIGKKARQAEAGEPSASDSPKASWNTTRTSPKQKAPYARRMAMSFSFIAALTSIVLIIVLAIVWEGVFQQYTRANMERLADATASTLAEEYARVGRWTDDVLASASSALSSSSGAGVQVLDAQGHIIYDDTWARVGSAGRTGGTSGSTALPSPTGSAGNVSLAPTAQDSIVSSPITLASGEEVGTVRVWVFGSEALLTKSDAAFRNTSYGAILAAGAIAILIASIAGTQFARTLAKPVNRITATAASIRNGDLTARTNLRGDDEIGQLGETFDDMATTLERDLKLEHNLTSDVAHELRTPLMAIQATVEAMQDGVMPCDQEHLGTLSGEVRRLSRLVEAMLQLSRIENGTTPFHPERTDIVWLVQGIISSQEQLFADQDLRLRMEGPSRHEGCFAEIDRDMVRQAVVNLLSNAMRYTPEGGWVVISVGEDRGDVLITVSDTGMGIAKEDLSRVFGRFWRSDASRERVSGGLGVGLSLTKEIVDRHHGFISVESELGRGTSFTIHLPHTFEGTVDEPAPAE